MSRSCTQCDEGFSASSEDLLYMHRTQRRSSVQKHTTMYSALAGYLSADDGVSATTKAGIKYNSTELKIRYDTL
jgi:hypothetical protein